MVEAAPQRKKLAARFTTWVNRLEVADTDLPKVTELR